MNVAVIGLGSMGKRRIRLIQSNFKDVNIVGLDKIEEKCKEAEELFSIKTSTDSDNILSNTDIDAVFISTSPLSHSKLIKDVLNRNINVFTELNLVNDLYDENIKLASDNNLTLFLSSTQLYRKEINHITEVINKSNKQTNYIYHIGNYLPDWHPWENYKDFFVGDKRTNGCREILAIELPWLINTFGEVEKIYVTKDKMTDLEIDYPDSFLITIQHKSGDKGNLIVDLVSRKPVRNLEIINEDFYFSWDGSPTGLQKYNITTNEAENIDLYDEIASESNYNETIIENAYLEEIYDFFDAISNNKPHGKYSFNEDKYILNLIDVIENSNDNTVYDF